MTNYESNPILPRDKFGDHFKTEAIKYFHSLYPNIFYDNYPGFTASFCLNYEDLKSNYDLEKAKTKEFGKELLILNDFKPSNAEYKPIANGVPAQSVSFILVD